MLSPARFALAEVRARKPVNSAPSVPPTACTPNVSSASSYPNHCFTLKQKNHGIAPAKMPITSAPPAVTKPQAGVITTNPATAPEQKPSTLGLPRITHSIIGHTNDATAVAIVVVMNALAATPSAATALPALKPYQPTHNMPVPMEHNTMLCGGMGSLGKPNRLPSIKHRINADQPEDMCTTVPPAKSIAWIFAPLFHTPFIMPVAPQTMCASGK